MQLPYKNNTPVREKSAAKLVIVENDPYAIASYHRACGEMPSLQLRIAPDGFVALVEICEFQPEILIIKSNVPNFDGFQLMTILNRHPEMRPANVFFISDDLARFQETFSHQATPPHLLTKWTINTTNLQRLLGRHFLSRHPPSRTLMPA